MDGQFKAPQYGFVSLLTPPDNCPSLGLAFAANFTSTHPPLPSNKRPRDLLVGNVELDSLPSGCEGCRETITGELQCCQERDE